MAQAGEDAAARFVEFFTANIRNPNTREAYALAVADFFSWCQTAGLHELGTLQPVHVAAYVEQLCRTHSAPSVKQHLAAVPMLFDWLVVGQVMRSNTASVVRGPKHVVKRGWIIVRDMGFVTDWQEQRTLMPAVTSNTGACCLIGNLPRCLLASSKGALCELLA